MSKAAYVQVLDYDFQWLPPPVTFALYPSPQDFWDTSQTTCA